MNLKPVYKFTWSDGSSRRTDNLEHAAIAKEAAVEALAERGRADADCTVTLVGHETL